MPTLDVDNKISSRTPPESFWMWKEWAKNWIARRSNSRQNASADGFEEDRERSRCLNLAFTESFRIWYLDCWDLEFIVQEGGEVFIRPYGCAEQRGAVRMNLDLASQICRRLLRFVWLRRICDFLGIVLMVIVANSSEQILKMSPKTCWGRDIIKDCKYLNRSINIWEAEGSYDISLLDAFSAVDDHHDCHHVFLAINPQR